MSLQIIHHDQVAQWVIDRMPEEGITSINEVGPFKAFGVYDTEAKKALCGVVYNWYRVMEHGNDMRAIIFAEDPRWCLPGILRELFRYPFEIAGCERLTVVVREGNHRSMKLCLGLGFRKEGVMRRGYNGKTNAIILGMLKSECKWLKRGKKRSPNGKEVSVRTSGARSGSDHCSAVGG